MIARTDAQLPPLPKVLEPPKPFLKWAGGKTQLLPVFTALYPPIFKTYHEPFLGSAAVYFHLYGLNARGALADSMTGVTLSDSNSELVNCYRVVKDNVEELVPLLADHKRKHSHSHFYAVREQLPGRLTDILRAARFIYLNKTCYNGLYRVNRRGQFNVPIGSYKNPGIFEAEALRRASEALQQAEIRVGDFHEVADRAEKGDFIYFDPPYHPLTKSANFTSYTQEAFGEEQQKELADVYSALDRRGCYVMLSNSWTPFVLELYKQFDCRQVHAARAINSNSERRGKISELVVLNYNP